MLVKDVRYPKHNALPASLQEAPVRLRQDLIIVGLEPKPPFGRRANLLVAKSCLLFWDERLLVPTALRSSIYQQLGLARLVEREEPESRGINRFADLGRSTTCQQRHTLVEGKVNLQ